MTDKTDAPADTPNETGSTAALPPASTSVIALNAPILRGDTTIDQITLRKPKAGELRGLTLQDLIGTDISTILKLIPRVSEPPLNDEECQKLDLADLSEIGGTIRGFFMTRAERDMIQKMMEEQQPTS